MVLFHVKNSADNQFLFEATVKESVDTLVRNMVHIWNTRLKIAQLTYQCERLGEFGPLKRPDRQGIDTILEEAGEDFGRTTNKNKFYKPDPMGQRTGNACDPKLLRVLNKTIEDARAACSKEQVAKKVPLTAALLKEKLDNLRGAVTICYPMGLPEWDPVGLAFKDEEELLGQDGKLWFDPEAATLWFAGKEFFRDGVVSDRIRHERSKVIAKLQKKGARAPAREAAVSESERKAMMAHYFKKNEEMKKVAECDDDDFLNSSWANPKALQQRLQGSGTGGLKFRMGSKRM